MARKREEKVSSQKSSPSSESRGKGTKSKYCEDQDDSVDLLKTQLFKLGLGIREVPGDGNCLFRAIGDQLEGHIRNHLRYRQDAVQYMLEHKEDFQPFVEDDVPFDKHISLLSQPGTYAGNDAIVALARLQGLTIVIHQPNAPLWQIHGWDTHLSPSSSAALSPSQRKELHIAYHGGDHYDSIRRLGDVSYTPANIRLANNTEPICSPQWALPSLEDETDMERKVILLSGCQDVQKVREALESNQFIVEAAVEDLIEATILTTTTASETDGKGTWGENGSGTRVLGGAAAMDHSTTRNLRSKSLSSKKARELKKQERKRASEDRKRGGCVGGSVDGDCDPATTGVVIRQVQFLNI